MNSRKSTHSLSHAHSLARLAVAVDLPYFSSPVRLGRLGVEEVLPLGPMDALEADNFAAMKVRGGG